MHISHLELTNYKCFTSLVLDALGPRVILVGPNGSGKSTVLEAIAVLKEYAGSYKPEPHPYSASLPVVGYTQHAWREDVAVPTRAGATEASVTATFELTPGEVALCGGGSSQASIGIVVKRSRGVNLTGDYNRLTPLFRNYTPSPDIGVVDYIGPSRSIPHTRAKTLDAGVVGLDEERKERVELPRASGDSQKLRNTKQYLISQDINDCADVRAGRSSNRLENTYEISSEFAYSSACCIPEPTANDSSFASMSAMGRLL